MSAVRDKANEKLEQAQAEQKTQKDRIDEIREELVGRVSKRKLEINRELDRIKVCA